ncbi:integrase arm-type DNA-binding domain-containing protein [Acetobacter suratthaniensis]|uniref:Integrase arm-type DNA-binding domain-containing protein n=1 Tax=Acetobacter suratthaniensis TaxID=1502841 RepID=A0ABS3LH27_9PROT|nr:integrase arm-type DNA-binding domain-containing protein [Acetobacter suratthaniensis]MBO1326894.1 integrase arm-type DNA-binding domain-containing protein [Acetobacter suratthaniensis]MCX2565499.1 integrase arm-type DNA-binding domain-containing protein [Acetobacter suratthaniensis]
MSRVSPHQLTARQVSALKDGALADGGGLWLVAQGGAKSWYFRFTSPVTGKRREMGIGSVANITLADARRRATEARHQMADGLDPIDERRRQKAQDRKETGITFAEVAQRYIKEMTPGWRDPRAATIWTSSLKRLAFPIVGANPVAEVETKDVLSILRPIWQTTTETADRLRGRIERILDYARTHGWRDGENPARWRGHLANILPKPSAVTKVRHHAAVPRQDIARVMARLVESEGMAAKAVRFTCLTAVRSGEVRHAIWLEIDMTAQIWTIPAERMKTGKEHRVPLSEGAMAILHEVLPLRDRRAGDLVFPGAKRGRPLSDVALSKALHLAAGTKEVTVHGLRSTFRDWAAEETDYPREVAEMALAHAISDKVEAAYRRGDLFDKRREMMAEWFVVQQST